MTTGQLTACAILSFAGFAGVAQATHMEIGWKDLAQGGAATMVIVVVVIFLRTISEMRKEHSEVVGRISTNFAEAVQSSTKEFADSTHRIIEAGRAHNQANIQMLQQIIQDLTEKK